MHATLFTTAQDADPSYLHLHLSASVEATQGPKQVIQIPSQECGSPDVSSRLGPHVKPELQPAVHYSHCYEVAGAVVTLKTKWQTVVRCLGLTCHSNKELFWRVANFSLMMVFMFCLWGSTLRDSSIQLEPSRYTWLCRHGSWANRLVVVVVLLVVVVVVAVVVVVVVELVVVVEGVVVEVIVVAADVLVMIVVVLIG